MLSHGGESTLLPQFRGKVVVITGAASGIGKALATAFARNEARVALVDVRVCDDVVDDHVQRNPSSKPLIFTCDVTEVAQVRHMIQQVKRQWGQIDFYCSNAGIIFPIAPDTETMDSHASVASHSDVQWNKILQVNVLSHVIAARELIADWEQGKGDGVFVVTASAAGLLTQIGDASYGVSKAAAISFAEHMTIAHPSIQVHCLCPQAVDTPFVNSKTTQNSAMTDGLVSPEWVAECTLQAIVKGTFWVFPHPKVTEYYRRKATDHARWIKGMQRWRQQLIQKNKTETSNSICLSSKL